MSTSTGTSVGVLQKWVRSPASWLVVLAICAGVYAGFSLFKRGPAARTYKWVCTGCNNTFSQPIPPDTTNQNAIPCPKCGKPAERVLHLVCRNCGASRDARGSEITPTVFACPNCNPQRSMLPE